MENFIIEIFFGIFVLIVGIIMLIKPDLWWNDTDSWNIYDTTDPSFFYYRAMRYGGMICTLVGVAVIILPLFQ